MDTPLKDPKKVAAAVARASALSPAERSAIAANAAATRWGTKPISALHKGNFKKEFGLDVDCYVLDDAEKTAVISQRGMGRTLGLSDRGNALPSFLASRAMTEIGGGELREKFQNPLRFQWAGGGGELPQAIIHGYNAALLIDLCNGIIAASDKLGTRYARVVNQARIILGASGKSGITRLVYDLSGYNPTADEAIAAFKLFVQEEARKYEPEFPNELYIEWHRLYNLAVPERGKPWQFRHLTVRHVYYPLAKSNGKILTLCRALKAADGDQSKKLFQFLNGIGARALRIQLGRVLEMAESSPNRTEYEKKIIDRFGGQRELDFLSVPAVGPQRPSPQLQLFPPPAP